MGMQIEESSSLSLSIVHVFKSFPAKIHSIFSFIPSYFNKLHQNFSTILAYLLSLAYLR